MREGLSDFEIALVRLVLFVVFLPFSIVYLLGRWFLNKRKQQIADAYPSES